MKSGPTRQMTVPQVARRCRRRGPLGIGFPFLGLGEYPREAGPVGTQACAAKNCCAADYSGSMVVGGGDNGESSGMSHSSLRAAATARGVVATWGAHVTGTLEHGKSKARKVHAATG